MFKDHPRAPTSYIIADRYDLPFRLLERYHNCGNYIAAPRTKDESGPPMCSNCDKTVPWFFHKCVICDVVFIQDFRHPKFCTFYPTCWTHTLELEWEYCETHSSSYTRERPIVEPLGYNPVIFTAEELEGVFDF